MYFIQEGLGVKYRPLSIMFSISGMFGCLVFFQANQLSQIIRDYFYVPNGFFAADIETGNIVTGFVIGTLVGIVIFGGIQRIARIASKLCPGWSGSIYWQPLSSCSRILLKYLMCFL